MAANLRTVMRLRRGSGEGEGDLFGSTFGEWVDRALLSDAAMICLGLLLFPAAHVAALVVALKAKRPSGIFVVNAAFSLLVLFYLLSQPEYFFDIFEGGKDPFWLPAAIEFAALGCAVAALLRVRWATAPSYAFFALNAIVLVCFAFLAIGGAGSH